MQYFTINASDLPRVTGLSSYLSYFGHILTILLFRLVRGLGLFLKILLLQTGQRLGLKTEKAREAAEAIIRSEKRSRLLNSRVEL